MRGPPISWRTGYRKLEVVAKEYENREDKVLGFASDAARRTGMVEDETTSHHSDHENGYWRLHVPIS